MHVSFTGFRIAQEVRSNERKILTVGKQKSKKKVIESTTSR